MTERGLMAAAVVVVMIEGKKELSEILAPFKCNNNFHKLFNGKMVKKPKC